MAVWLEQVEAVEEPGFSERAESWTTVWKVEVAAAVEVELFCRLASQ